MPPRTSQSGYKAAEWDVEKFLWKGRMRVVEIGERCEIKLEVSAPSGRRVRRSKTQDSNTGELFATVHYATPWTQVEPVLDSSRYFVLRVEGEGGKRAYIGMGFLERGEAFDFQVRPSQPCWARRPLTGAQVALQSVAKRTSTASTPADEPAKPAQPPKDYSLKEGQTFSIKIPGRDGKKVGSSGGGASLLGNEPINGGGLFSLPPPPPPGRRG